MKKNVKVHLSTEIELLENHNFTLYHFQQCIFSPYIPMLTLNHPLLSYEIYSLLSYDRSLPSKIISKILVEKYHVSLGMHEWIFQFAIIRPI